MPLRETSSSVTTPVSVFERNMLHNGVISPYVPNFQGFLWDTALIAEGIATYDPFVAAQQITQHIKGQHLNGMLPNEVVYQVPNFIPRRLLHYSEQAPNTYASNITQPPTIVTSAWEVSKRMPKDDRKEFLKHCFPAFVTYLGWIQSNRTDPSDGLPMLIHPHESGMDDNPVWQQVMDREWVPENLSLIDRAILYAGKSVLQRIRAENDDIQDPEDSERAGDSHVLQAYIQSRQAYKLGGDPQKILDSGKGAVLKDIGFNVLTAEANRSLVNMESVIGNEWYHIHDELYAAMHKLEVGIEDVHYDAATHEYHSIDVRTDTKLPAITASSILPLLTTRSATRQEDLVTTITDPSKYWTALPIPSVRADSAAYSPGGYWRGGSWPFLRYQVERALRRNGRDALAAALRSRVIYNPHVAQYGEFNNSQSGQARGVKLFSPSAAEALLYKGIRA